jgi:hypothetical protein
MQTKKAKDVYDQLAAVIQEASPVLSKELATYIVASCQKNIETNYKLGQQTKTVDSTIATAVEKNLERLRIFSAGFIDEISWFFIHQAGQLAFDEGLKTTLVPSEEKEFDNIDDLYDWADDAGKQYIDTILNAAGTIHGIHTDKYARNGGWNGLMDAISEYEKTNNISKPDSLEEVTNLFELLNTRF